MIARLPTLALYVHLPWCVSKCPYCDFNSHSLSPAASFGRYLEALAADLEAESARVRGREIETVFIGGGTPSLFRPAGIESILDGIAANFALAPGAEITMEANPGTVERGSLRGYRDAGVTRLSLGAQSFNPDSLRRLGRIHGPDEVLAAFAEARQAEFASINLDLMFALPAQTLSMALDDVDRAIALEPEHISCYQLTLEPNTVFFVRPPADLPDEDLGFELQEAAYRRLAAAGYRRYEVSAFARPGFECRHNLNYWSFGDYLGIGAGAHGKLTGEDGRVWRTQKTANPGGYVRALTGGSRGTARRALDEEDLRFEFMLNGLRLRAGFSLADFEARTGLAASGLASELAGAERDGLIERAGDDRWRPTELGFRFLNDLQARFLPPSGRPGKRWAESRAGPRAPAVMHKSGP